MFAELAVILTVGTLGFYLLGTLLCCWLIWTVEQEHVFTSIVTVAALSLVLYLLYGVNLLLLAWQHPGTAAVLVVGYFLIGAGWAFIKWGFHVQWVLDQAKPIIDEIRSSTQIAVRNGVETCLVTAAGEFSEATLKSQGYQIKENFFPEERSTAWKNTVTRWLLLRSRGVFFPNYRREKTRILFWVGMWPFSAIWNLIHKPVKYISEWLYYRLAGAFEGLTNYLVRRQM
jgi:hypothetical protein